MPSDAWKAGEKKRKDRARKERQARRGSTGKIVGWSLAALVVAGGIFLLARDPGDERRECPGHWHATFAIYVDGARVRFPQPPYNWDGEGGELPISLHMHSPNEEQIHFEPARPRCEGVQDTLDYMDVHLEADRIAFEGAHGNAAYAGEHVAATDASGNSTLRVFLQMPGSTLREVSAADVLEYQLRDREKMLVLYGTYSMEDIRQRMDAVGAATG